LEGFQQASVVPLVQANRRLVQHIEDTGKAAADLAGQANALPLPAGERGCWPIQSKVVQADVLQKLQALADLLQDLPGHLPLRVFQTSGAPWSERVDPAERFANGEPCHVNDGASANGNGRCLGAQAMPATGRAGSLPHEHSVPAPHTLRVRLMVAAAHPVYHALEALHVPSLAVVRMPLGHDLYAAIENGLLALRGQGLPRGVQRVAELRCDHLGGPIGS